jgi:hypothetical protein
MCCLGDRRTCRAMMLINGYANKACCAAGFDAFSWKVCMLGTVIGGLALFSSYVGLQRDLLLLEMADFKYEHCH